MPSSEQPKELLPPVAEKGKEKPLTPEELVEFRFRQSTPSRLAEYITGLRPDDPKMPQRLIADQEAVRGKYKLPSRQVRFENPTEYERFLRERAKQLRVRVRGKAEFGVYFQEHFASAMYTDNGHQIAVDMPRNDFEQYVDSLGELEHELTHAWQHLHSPRMPIELREYEAYVAGLNMDAVTKDPKSVESIFFGFFVQGSVLHWYEEENEHQRQGDLKLTPTWDDPEYFLKNVDHVDQEVIDAYKQKALAKPLKSDGEGE